MPVGIFPNSLKKLTAIYSKGGEGDTHPELPGKGEREAEGWGKRVSRLNT
jgi:acyl-CoA-binding protein